MYLSRLVLTDYGVNWLYENCTAVLAPDFAGYIFTLRPKYDVSVAVELTGRFIFFSLNKKKPLLGFRKYKKVIKFLMKRGFIDLEDPYEPFPEFCLYNNLKLNPIHTKITNLRMFGDDNEIDVGRVDDNI